MNCMYCGKDMPYYQNGATCTTCKDKLQAAHELAKYLKVLRKYREEQERKKKRKNATELHRQP